MGSLSYENIWKVTEASFSSPPPRVLYKRFMEALKQFIFCDHLVFHEKSCLEDIVADGVGATDCPACSPDVDFKGKLLKV